MSVSVSMSGRRLVMHYGGHRKTYRMVQGIYDLVLSPNGRQAIYIMVKPYYPHSVNMTDATPNSLWLLDAATGKNTQIAATPFSSNNKEDIAGIQIPVFSNDGTQLYFSSAGINSTDTIHAVDLATRLVRYVCDGSSLRVIGSGPYRDDLVIYEQVLYPDGTLEPGRNWLVSPQERRIKPWGSAKDGPEPE